MDLGKLTIKINFEPIIPNRYICIMIKGEEIPKIKLTKAEKALLREVCDMQQEYLLELADINDDISIDIKIDLINMGIDPIDFDLQIVKKMKQFDRLHKSPSKNLLRVTKKNTEVIKKILHYHFDNPLYDEARKTLLLKLLAKESNNHLN